MEKKWDVLIYGDANVDLMVPGVTKLPAPGVEQLVDSMPVFAGGGAALTALGLGKLGVKTAFKGILAGDFFGELVRNQMEQNGLYTSLIRLSTQNPTGISISFTDENNRSFLTLRGTNAELDMGEVTQEEVRQARHLHLTGYDGKARHEQYARLLKLARAHEGTTASLDVGWDDTGEWYEGIWDLLPYLDVLFLNETEAVHYGRCARAEEVFEKYGGAGKRIVLKLGWDGSKAMSPEGELIHAPAYVMKAVDTTGAGDSYNAGFLYGLLRGEPLAECMAVGNACGALSVTAYGGNTAFPNKTELEAFMKDR